MERNRIAADPLTESQIEKMPEQETKNGPAEQKQPKMEEKTQWKYSGYFDDHDVSGLLEDF